MKIRVLHKDYGCETGCCGHVIEVDGEEQDFYFTHAYDRDPLTFAQYIVEAKFGSEHVADLDWENSIIVAYD
jgi:hypothetical protein